MGVINHEDQLNWKNLSQGNSHYDDMMMAGGGLGDDAMQPPRVHTKRKVLPQIPVQSKYGGAKSLPATPATSAMGINGKSRRLPCPSGGLGEDTGYDGAHIPTSTTITGFSSDYSYDRPPYKSSLSADGGGDEYATGYEQQSFDDDWSYRSYNQQQHHQQQEHHQPPVQQTNKSSVSVSNRQTKPSLLADMKSLFSKTIPAMSSTLNNVSSSISASIPPVGGIGHVSPKCPQSSSLVSETDMSYDFMKSNKFEESKANNHSSIGGGHPEIDLTYYGECAGNL